MQRASRVERIVEIVAVGAIVALTAFFALGPIPSGAEWRAAAFFTAFGVIAAVLTYRTSQATAGTISFLPFLTAAIVAPNAAALITVSVSTLVAESVLRRQVIKLVFNTAQHTFAVAVAMVVYLSLGGRSVLDAPPEFVPFLALVAVYFTLNKLAVSTVVASTSGVSTSSHWLRSMRGSIVYDALSLPLILIFGLAYARLGPSWTAMLALPMLGVRQLYRTVFALEKVNEELLQLMVASIEARDPYTSGHSQRVSMYARVIARAAGISGRQLERVETAALLHDVGKIHEEFAAILRKPGALSSEEFETMKLHPAKSAELVAKVSHFADLVDPVRAHHEAWDGSGYPSQLRAAAIPLGARIIALADTVDAMTTSRPYRRGLSMDQVRDEIRRESGRQFDPAVCEKLLAPAAWAQLQAEFERAQAEHPPTYSPMLQVMQGNTGEFVAVAAR
jgi:HD-GYP domain-containing protein (c-di-GMP phosphodiesterase class II)